MTTVEHRKSRRYTIAPERAECKAIVGKRAYRAVLSDMSACGFGLLLLSGVQIESDRRVRLITDDGIHDCRIAYCRREESMQYIGVERLSDVSLIELPRRQKAMKFFRYGTSEASPVLFLAVVLGFTAFSTLFLLAMDSTRPGADDGVIVIDETPQHNPEIQVSMREKTTTTARKSVKIIRSYFHELSLQQRSAFNSVASQVNVGWDDLVDELKLTREQQRSVIALIQEQAGLATTKDQRFIAMRDGIRNLLQEGQQKRLDLMWVIPRPLHESPLTPAVTSATSN